MKIYRIWKYKQTFTAVIHREEVMFVAESPEVGTVSQRTTIEEAVANLKDATQLYLDEFPIDSKPVRSFVTRTALPRSLN